MRLRISPAMVAEWDARCIGDVIPALRDIDYQQGSIEVDLETAAEIAEDCKFYIDPKAVDATAGERAAYRALLRQML